MLGEMGVLVGEEVTGRKCCPPNLVGVGGV